ncbi:MAG TPA: mandelate racemase, partial [Roseovarius nubinhibens]|nr:mandelate racemase [Roseovarius nubinhibens]
VMSVQDTVGSQISFAAILHLAQSAPRHLLRCALDTRAMTTAELAEIDAPLRDGGASAPYDPGLGLRVNRDALGTPINTFGDLK